MTNKNMWPFEKTDPMPFTIDLHSHLLPSLDDGTESFEQALEILQSMSKLGVKKIITTPHINTNYPNTNLAILEKLEELREHIKTQNIDIEVNAAAEYLIDETFYQKIKNKEPLLTFGGNYVLVETNFFQPLTLFDDVILELCTQGYFPVLAHPERYRYIDISLNWLIKAKEKHNIKFQVTLCSFSKFYGYLPYRIANRMLKMNMIDFLGSDLHNENQLEFLDEAIQSAPIQKLIHSETLLNNTL